jgi:hypothetical protein
MEPASLATSIVGVAGLFSSCIDCFQLVQRGGYMGPDYLLLETKFANQHLRLSTWGRACGLTGSGPSETLLLDKDIRNNVAETLVHIIHLFEDGKTLKKRDGLTAFDGSRRKAGTGSAIVDSLIPILQSSSLTDFSWRRQSTAQNRLACLSKAARWAIDDKRKFTDLVQHLKDLVDNLEGLVKSSGILQRQREFIQIEVESISDIPELEAIEEARFGRTDPVADAASVRLWLLQDQPAEGNPTASAESSGQCSTDPDEGGWEAIPSAESSQIPVTNDACYQVMHRVHCEHYPTMIFLDSPTYHVATATGDQWVVLNPDNPHHVSCSLHLRGRWPILDLEAYLSKSARLFLALKEYQCSHDMHKPAIILQVRHKGLQSTRVLPTDGTSSSLLLVLSLADLPCRGPE